MRNFYQVLGTTSAADNSQLKSAYRNLAKTFHPDLNAGDKRAEERFKALGRAYEVLRDPEARAAYDAFLADKQTGVRHRLRNAALTMSAAFVLTAAVCFSLMVWLQGEKPYLWTKQESSVQSGNVAVAVRHDLSGADGPPAQKAREEDAMLSASPPPEPGGVVQKRGEEALQGRITETDVERAPRDQTPLEWDNDVIGSKVSIAVEPRRTQRDDTRRAAILDRASKQPSDKARGTDPTKVPVAERAEKGTEKGTGKRIATVSASPPAVIGSDKFRGWLTADEPFIGPGGTSR